MAGPDGEYTHPRMTGFGGRGSAPSSLAALIWLTLLLFICLLWTPAPAAAIQFPRLVPPATEIRESGDAGPNGLAETTAASPTGRWIVAGRPGRSTHDRAVRFGADPVSRPLGIYAVDENVASALVDSLRSIGTYRFSEPDVPTVPEESQSDGESADDPLDQWWLDDIRQPGNVPKVRNVSPVVALLEHSLDPTHPDLAGLDSRGRLLDPISFGDDRDAKGTAMAALAASLDLEKDGRISGTWPGMKVRLVSSEDTCEAKTRAVYRAARSGGNRVLVMGYSFPAGDCFSHYLATEYAVYRNIVPVAAAGETARSNTTASPPRPAGDPHVLTVTASDPMKTIPAEARRGPWVDLTAPGYGLTVPWVSSSGQRNWSTQNGTAYSAAITAAAAAWVMERRPALTARQVIRLLTNTATTLGAHGRSSTSGHGLLNMKGALTSRAPIDDPFEPNDDIGWVRANSLLTSGVGGKKIGRRLFWGSNGRPRKVTATLSRAKDPNDVYRIRIAPGARVTISVSQFVGRTTLKVFGPKSGSITKGRPVGSSDRPPGKRADAVEIRNRSPRALGAFIAIGVSPKKGSREHSTYRMSVESRR